MVVAGLEDGLVPENDDFNLGKVRKRGYGGKGVRRCICTLTTPIEEEGRSIDHALSLEDHAPRTIATLGRSSSGSYLSGGHF